MHVYRMILENNPLLISLFLSGIWMCFLYLLALLILRALQREDVVMLPGGEQLALFLRLP